MCALVVKRSVSERLFKNVHGLVSVYKPPSMTLADIVKKLKYTLVATFNDKPCRPMEKIVKVDDETDSIYITKNLADSPLGIYETILKTNFTVIETLFLKLLDHVSYVKIFKLNSYIRYQKTLLVFKVS
jgi:hypothetical protein